MSKETPATIRLKIERAFVAFAIANKAGRFDGLEIVGGHEPKQPKGAHLCLYCRQPRENPELPPRSREYIAPLEGMVQRPMSNSGVARLEEQFENLKVLLEDMDAIRAFMNLPAAGTADRRAVRRLHIIDVQPRDEDEDRLADEREDYFAGGWEIVCADFDSPPE